MDYRHRFDLEVRINELATRRRMLDKQLELRSSTMAELGQVREMSMKRLCNAVEAQNEQAKARNQELREYLYSSASTNRQPALKSDSHRSANRLKEAKEQYLKHVEATLPIWHRYQTVQLEENVRNIQVEKALSIKRREQLQSELMRENTVKQQLERHRQELLYSLAAEQRIMLESKANAVLLEEESKATNAQVAYELSMAANEMNELVASNVYKMRQATSMQNDALLRQSAERHEELCMRQPLYQPQPYQPTLHAHQFHQKETDLAHHQHAHSMNIPAAGFGSLVRPTELDAAPEYIPQTEPSQRRDDSLPMSPTAASVYHPRSRSSSAAPLPILHPASASSSTPQVAVASRPAPVFQSTPKHTNLSMNRSEDNYNTTMTSPLTEASRSGLLHQTQLDADMTFTTAIDANESALSLLGHRQDTSFTPKHKASSDHAYGQESTHHKLFNGALDTHIEETEEDQTPNSKPYSSNLSLEVDLPYHSFVAPARQSSPALGSLPTSPNTKLGSPLQTYLAEDDADAPAPTPTKRPFSAGSVGSPRSSFTVPIEVRPGGTPGANTSGRGSFFSVEEEHSTHSLSRQNSTFASDQGSTKSNSGNNGNNIATLVENLSIAQCTALLSAVCKEIEHRATEFPAPVSVSVIYDTTSRHRAVHIIDAFLTSGSADNANLSAVLSNAADSTLGNAVLAMVEGKSNILIPSEAFTGVMTMEKLKKEYKRGPAGVLQLWDRLVAHLMRLVEHSANALNFLSLCFTDALTAHVDEDDKSRLARKVSNLLQLALIPPQSKDQRSPSPPYRSRTNYNTTSPSQPTTAASNKPNVNNPNTSGFSLSSASDDESEPAGKGAEKKPFSSYVPSRGSPNKSALNISAVNNSAIYGKASSVVKVTKAATEFDDDEIADDEIADDETIERPPPLRDLDTSSIGPANPRNNNNNNHSSVSYSSSDSSSVQPVSRSVRVPGGNNNNVSMNVSSSQGRNNNNRNNDREEFDEFDF
eukprot:gene8181-9740_t